MRINAPKGVLSDELRAQIAERKAELLDFLKTDGHLPPLIPRRTSSKPAPLSFAQERLWFLEQLEPGNTAYNIYRAWRVTGKLNVTALEKSLNEIVRRHEVLRSAIQVKDGKPVQALSGESGRKTRKVRKKRPEKLKVRLTTLKSEVAGGHKVAIQRRIQGQAERPFDFSEGCFLRAAVLRTGKDEQVLILTTHHMMADAWSMGILTRELWSLYEAFADKKPFPLTELPIQYFDFAVWQRQWLQGEVIETQLAYWKKQLSGVSPLNLPTDRPRPARQTFAGERVSLSLPASLSAAVNDLSLRYKVTPFMTLLAAFQVLLYRYTGQEDIAVGSPIANRSRSEVESLIGFFVNTLVIRSDLSGAPSFKDLLTQVREVCLGTYAHQDLPFEKLVEELKPERDQSRNPLFQVMFALQNATRPFAGPANLRVEPVEIESTRSRFDLSLFLRERDGKFIGYIEYNTDLFNRGRIERMGGHFQTLLESIVINPEQSIAMLPILTDAERQQILVEWNDTAADYPNDKCIHRLFEEQVERMPDEIAIEFQDQQLSYRELNCRTNQVAHHLISLGVGPEKLVGICVERSIEMVIGLWGILKAGGAYVPLDPAYPEERLRFMLDDAGYDVLLTQQEFLARFSESPVSGGGNPAIQNPKSKIKNVVCLDSDWPSITQQSDDNPKSNVGPGNLAYVIYTSGSTGKPKGVQVSHRSVVNCLCAVGNKIGLSAQDIWLGVTTICFDIAALEMFLPLITGAKAVLASREESFDGVELSKRLRCCGATVMQGTPTAWNILLHAGWQRSPKLKVLCGGEALSRRLADLLIHSGAPVWNLYGPTETTIWSTIHRVDAGDGPVCIGRPIDNTQVYILDAYMQPVPIGVDGDLYIGGDSLARGYLDHDELTAERFIRSPFSEDSSARLYRTGDRARFLADGSIRFVGRTDNQVKLRGYRIELGEIEAVLNQRPEVTECAVVASSFPLPRRGIKAGVTLLTNAKREEASPSVGEGVVSDSAHRLDAYYVCNDETLSPGDLRKYLGEKLPGYMVPSSFLKLDALPRTPNGKIDRKALPLPEMARAVRDREFVAPRTEIQELIAQTWRDIFTNENLSIHDSFFELGGHSLLAMQILARLREAFDREIPLSALFDAPTVAGLSVEVEKLLKGGQARRLPLIVPVPRDGALPLSMNQLHLWRLDQLMPGTHFFNMPYVYRLSGVLNITALEQAVKEIVRRHEALRTVFREMNGNPVQVIQEAGDFHLPYVALRGASADEVSQRASSVILEERERPFSLVLGPPMRTKLLRLTETEYLFLVTIHHIVSDHWSMQIFRRELLALYEAYSQELGSPLPEPVVQFADYALWEQRVLQQGFLAEQVNFWKTQLERAAPEGIGESPTRKKARRLRVDQGEIEFDQELLANLKALRDREHVTTFMVVLSALITRIYRHTSQTDIRICVPIANRARETEETMGHFMNTAILCIHVEPSLTLRDLLAQARRVSLAAAVRKDLPFEYLARELEKNNYERTSLSQVLLTYQNSMPRPIDYSGSKLAVQTLRLRSLFSEPMLSAFDVVVNVHELSTKLTASVNYRSSSQLLELLQMEKWFKRFVEVMHKQPELTITEEVLSE